MNTTLAGSSGSTRSSTCSSIGLPATLTSGLGLIHVCGRRRVPNPATGNTMSTFSSGRSVKTHWALARPIAPSSPFCRKTRAHIWLPPGSRPGELLDHQELVVGATERGNTDPGEAGIEDIGAIRRSVHQLLVSRLWS